MKSKLAQVRPLNLRSGGGLIKRLMNLGMATPHAIMRNNKAFAFIIAGGLGILGSVMSFMIAVASIIVFLLQLGGKVRKSEHPDIWKIALTFLMFFLVNLILSIIHFDGGRNLPTIIERLPFLGFFPLAMALSYSSRKELRYYLEYGAALGSLLTLIVVMSGFVLEMGRAEGGNGNPGPFALAVCIAFAICLLGLLRNDTRRHSILMFFGAAAAFICVLVSGTRTLWPALLLVFLIAVWNGDFKRLWNKKTVYFACVALLFLIIALIVDKIVMHRLNLALQDVEQIFTQGNYNNSLGQRLIMWHYAWANMPEAILIGLGEAKAISGMNEYAMGQLGYVTGWSHFHNFIITAIMRGGILELITTLAIFLVPLIISWKHSKDEISRYGFSLMLAIVLIFVESGMLNIALGHDIMDSLYTYMMAFTTWLVIGESGNRRTFVQTKNANQK